MTRNVYLARQAPAGTPSVSPEFLKGIERFRKTVGEQSEVGYVVYNGRQSYTS